MTHQIAKVVSGSTPGTVRVGKGIAARFVPGRRVGQNGLLALVVTVGIHVLCQQDNLVDAVLLNISWVHSSTIDANAWLRSRPLVNGTDTNANRRRRCGSSTMLLLLRLRTTDQCNVGVGFRRETTEHSQPCPSHPPTRMVSIYGCLLSMTMMLLFESMFLFFKFRAVESKVSYDRHVETQESHRLQR